MKLFKMLPLTAAVLVSSAFAQTGTPEPTDVILKKATAEAAKQKTNVMVIFHASWCGWCKKLDQFLDTTEEGKIVKKNVVVVHLTVLENPDKKNLENPGSLEFLTKLGGEKAGLPYFAIINPKGDKVIDSLQKKGDENSNTGYPAAKGEIEHFIKMLEVGVKKIAKSDRDKIATWLTKNAPK
jgi:thiol-disulfide isomerase/thioredoxin